MKMKKLILMAAMLWLSVVANAQQVHTEDWGNGIERSLVYRPGDYDSKFYRIPAIVTAKDGSIVTTADKRIETMVDLPGKIDVVCRRSEDGGKTWSDYVMIAANDSIGGYGDASLVVDQKTGAILCVFLHGAGFFTEGGPGHISYSKSLDNGKTWSKPVDINPQIMTNDRKGPQPLKCDGAFATSGRALQLANGRIIFAMPTRQKGSWEFNVYAVYSDDCGETWHVSRTPAILKGDESKIEQLADGSLLMSIRNHGGGPRIFSRSYDNGETWTDQSYAPTLQDPACNGDLLRYNRDGIDVLLHSLPGDPKGRNNVTIFVSKDNGKSWERGKTVVTCPSAYSSMTILPDGSIGILTEESSNGHYSYDIWFTKLPIQTILD